MLTLYFSGTGNSRYVAELFAEEMGCECLSIEEDADFGALIGAADAVAFVYPIYASRMPRILREFILAHKAALHGKKLVILCTQMGFSGDGARSLADLLDKGTYKVLYAEHLMMPNNINNCFIFPKTSDRRILRLKKAAQRRIRRVWENIKAGVVKKRGFNPFSRFLGLWQAAYLPLMDRVLKNAVHIDDDCTGCGLCVKNCPMRNLSLENGKAAAHGNCTKCYRCINSCPERAIAIYFRKKVHWQYHGVQDKRGNASA
ncbi:MAG: EFR1 family ferrodoxin [Clostridiales bacterium]|nr:EFR1 family ferrodoxin [Clostridiales bacterium]